VEQTTQIWHGLNSLREWGIENDQVATIIEQTLGLIRSVLMHKYLEIIRLRAGREQAWQAAARERHEASEGYQKISKRLHQDLLHQEQRHQQHHAEHVQRIAAIEAELRAVKRERGCSSYATPCVLPREPHSHPKQKVV